MTGSSFSSDLESALTAIESARAGLSAALESLDDADLDRERRGGWSVRRILEHVVEADQLYAAGISVIQCRPAPSSERADFANVTAEEIRARIEDAADAVLAAVAGVAEDDFYRIERLGREEYSVLSILENVANHYEEHAEQIARTLSA